jgi:hypothetical protein
MEEDVVVARRAGVVRKLPLLTTADRNMLGEEGENEE